MFQGVTTNKLNGGLGQTNPTDDNAAAIVFPVADASLPADVEHYTPYGLIQASDAVALGLGPAFDANVEGLLYYSITEVFRLAPDAQLPIILVPDSVTTPLAAMQAAAFKNALKLVPAVKGLAFVGFAQTVAQLVPTVEDIQTAVNSLATENRLLDYILLEGVGAATPTAISAYSDLRTKAAANVSICIGQDTGIAALDAAYAKYADVGAVLGMGLVRRVNENWGSVDIANKPAPRRGDIDYPLSSGSRWAVPALSDGTLMGTLTIADAKSLTEKGYIFADSYAGYGGVFLNGSPTCVQLSSDYSFIENNRVWNKAARGIRKALIPRVKGVAKKDPATGFLRSTTVSALEQVAARPLERMVAADEISGYSVFIDPKQTVGPTTPLKVKATVVKDDIIHEIVVDLGLGNQA